jgi:outer membrane protein OmpA-like peptidoglycan-associated protein
LEARTTARPDVLAIIVALATTCFGSVASAAPPRQDGVDIQQFRPGGGASDYLHLSGGFMGRHLGLSASLIYDHADVVLLTDRKGDGVKSGIVDGQDTLNLGLSFGLWERLELGIAMPLIIDQAIGPAWPFVNPGVAAPNGFQLGDLRLTPKVKIVDGGRQFSLAIAAPISLPTGQTFGGFGSVSVEPRVVIDWNPAYYFRLTLNLGGRFRDATPSSGLVLGEELTWGLGMKLSFFLGDQLFSVLTSFAGSFELPDQKLEDPPFEFLGGLEWRGVKDLAVYAAAGAGLTRGYGSPDLRGVVGVRYGGYQDCPYGEEDFDGFEDDDACADLDNDRDKILDEADLCPNEPETPNGWMDTDGCPDEPIELATVLDGKEDADALTRDTDGDGIPDAFDHCPGVAEDMDGFEDGDGCPEPDNDNDGVLDVFDRCPLLAEVKNGFEDEDGCPDVPTGPVRIDDIERQITITDKIYFDTGKATIQSRSFELLDAIATVLLARPDVKLLRIEGHTDDVGPAEMNRKLSGNRAAAVATYLIGKGVAADRLETRGVGEDEPIATNKTAVGRAANRRVEFKIVEYGQDGTQPPTTTPLESVPVPE